MAKRKSAKKKPVQRTGGQATKRKGTKKRRPRGAKTAPVGGIGGGRKAFEAKLAGKKGGRADLDPDQKQLNGFEGDRIPEVEKIVKSIISKNAEAKTLADEAAELTTEIPGLFRKHKINRYSCLGKEVTVEPTGEVVKILKAKKTTSA